MYESIGGFSLTSAVCAPIGTAHAVNVNNAHNPVKTHHSLLLIFVLLL